MSLSNEPQWKARRSAFLQAMSQVASTVSIVATDGGFGRAGATISSLVSVSADSVRPTLLVCLHRDTETAQAVLENQVFTVNILGPEQKALADIFAGRSPLRGPARFNRPDWEAGATGAPRLTSALVTLDCRVADAAPVGLHHVIYGQVEEITAVGTAAPLVYVNRDFATAVPLGTDAVMNAA